MRYSELEIGGVFLVEAEPASDSRGHFARWYDSEQFRQRNLEPTDAQGAVSHNIRRGTLRGLHFIPEAEGEAKLVRCVRGSLFDVVVDMRPSSSTFRAWLGRKLSAQVRASLYVPRGCAHGFITLEDETDIAYQFSMPHRPGLELGVRWDDPEIGVTWPMPPAVMSDHDRNLPFLNSLSLT